MPSNKFSGRYYFGGPPPQCKKPPIKGLPLIGLPRALDCMIVWVDLDPEIMTPPDLHEILYLYKTAGQDRYWGGKVQVDQPHYRIEATITRNGSTNLWDCRLDLKWNNNPEDDFTWPNVYIDPNKFFDTRTLEAVFQPWKDFRQLHATPH